VGAESQVDLDWELDGRTSVDTSKHNLLVGTKPDLLELCSLSNGRKLLEVRWLTDITTIMQLTISEILAFFGRPMKIFIVSNRT